MVRVELTPADDFRLTLPARNRSIVLVSKLHLPTLRALAYARATQPSHLEAMTVDVDEAETLRLTRGVGRRANMPVPLTVIASPYREITRPVVDYVKRLRRESPRDIVTVYVPRVRGRPLVGAAAAQPERAAAEDPAAAAARRGRGQRALPAALGHPGSARRPTPPPGAAAGRTRCRRCSG